VILQGSFRHVRVSIITEIIIEFSFVGIQECRDHAQSNAPESRIRV
jgi:hypothetical protein